MWYFFLNWGSSSAENIITKTKSSIKRDGIVSPKLHTSSQKQKHVINPLYKSLKAKKNVKSFKIFVFEKIILLQGHYILSKTIGEGTFGKVKLGTHILSHTIISLKFEQICNTIFDEFLIWKLQFVWRDSKVLLSFSQPKVCHTLSNFTIRKT